MQNNESKILSIRENAKAELQQLKTIEDGMVHLSKLDGIEAWVKAQKLDVEIHALVLERELRTKRIVGQLLKDGKDRGEIDRGMGGNRKFTVSDTNRERPKTIADLGISRHQSSDFQKLASIPEEVFEEHIAEAKAEVETAVKKLTTTGAVKLAEQLSGKTDKYEAMETAREIGDKLEMEKRIKTLLLEINGWKKIYRMKIKQSIK